MQQAVQSQTNKPLINPAPPAADAEHVNAIFSSIEQQLGFVPDGVKLYSLSPPVLDAFLSYVGYFNQGGTPLPKGLPAMIRYLSAWDYGCSFCVDMNESLLVNLGKDLDTLRAARNNPDQAPLAEKDKVLLKLALKAANSPEFVSKADLDQARQQGWQERDLFDTVVQAAGMRAFNIVLRTFKVEHQGAFA